MGGRLAFGREIGRQDHLLHHGPLNRARLLLRALPRRHPLKQTLQPDLLRADAVERAELAHQHEIQSAVSLGALHRRLIGRRLDHAQLAAIALSVLAGCTDRLLAQGIAKLAVTNTLDRLLQGLRQLQGASSVVLQHVKGHARR